MALRDQPYIPLYIQDFLTDEKLIECSAEATGVYIRLMCILHKSEDYGKILLKQKDKQTDKQSKNFALKIAKQMPYPVDVVTRAIDELLAEKVLTIENDFLIQKRMVSDNLLSLKRAQAGKKGGEFAQAKIKANPKANPENEDVNEIVNEFISKGVEKDFTQPDVNGDEIHFAYDTTEVRAAWAKWKEYRFRQHGKTYPMFGEQAALKQLAGMTEQQTIDTIFKAIESNWLNLYPDKNGNGKQTKRGFDIDGAKNSIADYLAKHG